MSSTNASASTETRPSACALGAMLGLGGCEHVEASPQQKKKAETGTGDPLATNLFVATTLEWFEEPKSIPLPNEMAVVRGDTVVRFRKLTPPYLAWIHKQFSAAELQYEQGNVGDNDIAELCERYFAICDWVCERVGEEKLRKLVETTNISSFKPPVNVGIRI